MKVLHFYNGSDFFTQEVPCFELCDRGKQGLGNRVRNPSLLRLYSHKEAGNMAGVGEQDIQV